MEPDLSQHVALKGGWGGEICEFKGDDSSLRVPDGTNPSKAWKELLIPSEMRIVTPVPILARLEPSSSWNSEEIMRVICISDTHGRHQNITDLIPKGDLLIHAGDFTKWGAVDQIQDFCDWFAALPHRNKVLIAGNHDLTIDAKYYQTLCTSRFHRGSPQDSDMARRIVTEHDAFTYLENGGTTVGGFKIWGSPYQPKFGNWAFSYSRGRGAREVWSKVPTDTDILVTHGPALGFHDRCITGVHAGCIDLLAEVVGRIRPALHVCGHIHEDFGMSTNGETTFVNASSCNLLYRTGRAPIIIDLPRKKGSF